MTVEEMQERILELEEQNQTLTQEKEKLSDDNKTLTEDIQRVRAVNQKYFEKLSMQENPETKEDEEEPEVPTCEEFAMELLKQGF